MRIFITGIVGTLGTALALLHRRRGDTVAGCSRNEERAIAWRGKHEGMVNHVADAGGREMLKAMDACDRVYHCAALKHVDICEQNPLEAWRQNVLLTADVVNARTIFISSDKACAGGGMGVYGATKLTAERIAVRAGAAVVRLGNLVGSSGSVFALWRAAAAESRPIRITDRSMTRYFLGVDRAADFAADAAVFGKVVVPNPLRSAVMGEIADAVARGGKVVEVGRRPGETRHQWLVSPDEPFTTASGKLVLGCGDPTGVWHGRCSSHAPKWHTGELLRLAGIET